VVLGSLADALLCALFLTAGCLSIFQVAHKSIPLVLEGGWVGASQLPPSPSLLSPVVQGVVHLSGVQGGSPRPNGARPCISWSSVRCPLASPTRPSRL
jgi:hypothetical protein